MRKNLLSSRANSLTRRIIQSPLWIPILIFIFLTIIVVGLSFDIYDREFYKNLLVEAHGMLFDLLIIGIIVFWLNALIEKRTAIQKYLEEIEDLREIKSAEAISRIKRNIIYLSKNGVTDINLSMYYLRSIDLIGVDLSYANFHLAVLHGAHLSWANLHGATLRAYLTHADLQRANLQEADLVEADLEEANLYEADLQGADLTRANLRKANLIRANLMDANLSEANLEDAILEKVNLRNATFSCRTCKGAGLEEAELRGTKEISIDDLSEVRSLFKAKVDQELMERLREDYRFDLLLKEPS